MEIRDRDLRAQITSANNRALRAEADAQNLFAGTDEPSAERLIARAEINACAARTRTWAGAYLTQRAALACAAAQAEAAAVSAEAWLARLRAVCGGES